VLGAIAPRRPDDNFHRRPGAGNFGEEAACGGKVVSSGFTVRALRRGLYSLCSPSRDARLGPGVTIPRTGLWR